MEFTLPEAKGGEGNIEIPDEEAEKCLMVGDCIELIKRRVNATP
jgi:hypothetical protein